MRTWLGVAAGVWLAMSVGCGGIAVIDGDGAGGASSASASSTSVSSSSTSGGESALVIDFESAVASANCQPPVQTDPLRVLITLDADNGLGTANGSVSVEAAAVSGVDGTTSFATDPADFIIAAGNVQQVTLEKVNDSGVGTNGCAYCNSTDLQVQLELLVDGEPQLLTGAVSSISCAF